MLTPMTDTASKMTFHSHMRKSLMDRVHPSEDPQLSLSKKVRMNFQTNDMFKSTANLALKGNTWDARHLDHFMNSPFARKPAVEETLKFKTGMRKSESQRTFQETGIRPSASFAGLNRYQPTQKIFFDQYEGTSSLLKRTDVPTFKEKTGGDEDLYESEQKNFKSLAQLQNFNHLPQIVNYEAPGLKTSQQRKQEMLDAKSQMNQLRDFKEQFATVNKRDRMIKNAWKHGILGVVNPEDPGSGLYAQKNQELKYKSQQKAFINERRNHKNLRLGGTSSQIEFCKEIPHLTRKDKKEIDINPLWTKKSVSPVRFQDSHSRIFIDGNVKWDPTRANYLRGQEKRAVPYGIIEHFE